MKITEENKKIIDEWYSQFQKFDKLNINDAKNLYQKYMQEANEDVKLKLREQLIYGMMHVVYNLLSNSHMDYFKSSLYTMDDIISETVNYLIDCIDEGKLLKMKFFSSLFGRDYYLFISNKFFGKSHNPLLKTQNHDIYQKILLWYFQLKDEGIDIEFGLFEDYMKSIFNLTCSKASTINYVDLYNGLAGFYKYCTDNDFHIEDVKKMNQQLRDFMNNIGLNMEQTNSKDLELSEDEFFNKIYFDELKQSLYDIIYSSLLTPKERAVICMSFGLYEKEYTHRKIAKYLNISYPRVGQLESSAMYKLKSRCMRCKKDDEVKIMKKWLSYKK